MARDVIPQPTGESAAHAPIAGLTETLCAHVTGPVSIDGATLDATRQSLMDQLGVILAAVSLAPELGAFADLAKAAEGGPARVFGTGIDAPAPDAAFANGALAHALDFEDTHDETLVHPHAAVVPAALAVGQATGATGRAVLEAIAIGADIACRLALGFRKSPETRHGFLVTPLIGAHGAAAAAGRLLGLDAAQQAQAFALTFSQVVATGDVQLAPASHFRAMRDGFNARAGVTGALLAQGGINGFDRVFEGPGGYYASYAGGDVDLEAVTAGLGTRYEGAHVSFKPWPSCRGSHAFVEAALALRQAHGIDSGDITGIDVEVSPFFVSILEPRAQRIRPGSAPMAKFSIPFVLGVALARGGVALPDFTPDSLEDAEVLRLAELTRYSVREDWTHRQSTKGSVTLTLADGTRLHHAVDHPRGHASNPMSADELTAKFRSCAALAPDAKGRDVEAVIAMIARLETLDDINDLARAL